MTTASALEPIRTTQELLESFTTSRVQALNRRGRQHFMEVIDTLSEYLHDSGAEAVDLRRDATEQPRARVCSLTRALELLDEFEDECLIRELDAEPEFIRRAEHVIRDFTRWLRGKAMRSLQADG